MIYGDLRLTKRRDYYRFSMFMLISRTILAKKPKKHAHKIHAQIPNNLFFYLFFKSKNSTQSACSDKTNNHKNNNLTLNMSKTIIKTQLPE